MGEHHKAEVKGDGYKAGQGRQNRGRYIKVASPSDEWYERRFPGYIERKRKAKLTKAENDTTIEGVK